MPATEHVEKHFTATAAVRDIVIGMSDGLTVPFALAAGLDRERRTGDERYHRDRRARRNRGGLDRHGAWADIWPRRPIPSITHRS